MRLARRDEGSMVPAVLVMVLGAVLTVSLAIEVGRFVVAVRNAAFVADLTAEAGASSIDTALLDSGELAIDQEAAKVRAHDLAGDLGTAGAQARSLDVTTTPAEVCVLVEQTYEPVLLPLPGMPISASACATPAAG